MIWLALRFASSKLFTLLPSLSGLGAAVAALFSAIPATLEALGKILREIAVSPVLSLLLGIGLGGVAAAMYVSALDLPARDRAKALAIREANARAAVAISNAKADFERQLAALKKQAPRKQAR